MRGSTEEKALAPRELAARGFGAPGGPGANGECTGRIPARAPLRAAQGTRTVRGGA